MFVIHLTPIFFIPSSYVSLIIHNKPKANRILTIPALPVGAHKLRASTEYREQTEQVEFCTQHDCGVTVKKMYVWQGRLDYAQLIALLWPTSYIK
jgi:hypothetical protein